MIHLGRDLEVDSYHLLELCKGRDLEPDGYQDLDSLLFVLFFLFFQELFDIYLVVEVSQNLLGRCVDIFLCLVTIFSFEHFFQERDEVMGDFHIGLPLLLILPICSRLELCQNHISDIFIHLDFFEKFFRGGRNRLLTFQIFPRHFSAFSFLDVVQNMVKILVPNLDQNLDISLLIVEIFSVVLLDHEHPLIERHQSQF